MLARAAETNVAFGAATPPRLMSQMSREQPLSTYSNVAFRNSEAAPSKSPMSKNG
jgi:hypothetical protein